MYVFRTLNVYSYPEDICHIIFSTYLDTSETGSKLHHSRSPAYFPNKKRKKKSKGEPILAIVPVMPFSFKPNSLGIIALIIKPTRLTAI